jgi:hypothetical protein
VRAPLTVVGGTASEPSAAGAGAASAHTAPLHDAGYLDDDLLEGPRKTPRRRGPEMTTAEAVSHLIGRLSARLLARLGGSEPDLRVGS